MPWKGDDGRWGQSYTGQSSFAASSMNSTDGMSNTQMNSIASLPIALSLTAAQCLSRRRALLLRPPDGGRRAACGKTA